MLLASVALLIFSQVAISQTASKRKTSVDPALPIAVSGHEERLTAAIHERVKALGPKTDNLGNVYVTMGKGAPHKLISVAMDEPGYVVSGITEEGYLRVQRLPQAAVTPVFDVLNFAQPVWVFTRGGKNVNGVFAGLSVHLQPGRVGGPKMSHPDELFVDIGAKNAAEVAAAGVDVLDAVATQRNLLAVGREEISGQSSGDRTALLAMLALLEKARPNEIKGTLTVAFVAQQWTGGRGMNRLLSEVHPDEMIFVGHVATPSPADGTASAAAAKLGSGILIGTASAEGSAADFPGELKALAGTKQIPVTLVSANLPRIAGYVPGAEYPKRTVAIGMPTLWAETPAETVNRKDAANLFELLADYAGVGANEEIKPEYSANETLPGTIEELVVAYGASGHEAAVREKVKELLPEWARKQTRTDDAGNLILHLGDEKPGGKTPRLAFVSHMDEIGYEVKKIEDDGRITLEVLGGGYPQYFLGHTALLHKSDGSATGAVMELPGGWEKPGFEWPQSLRTMDDPARGYVGTSSREETEKLGIKAGDWLTIEKAYRPMIGTRAIGRSFDDRVGCTALINAVRALGPNLPGRDVTFIWSTQEEVGLKGAAVAAARMFEDGKAPDFVFAIDTFVSNDSPLEAKRFGNAKLGKGFVVRAVDNSNIIPLEYVERVVKLARQNKIPVQYGVTGGGNDGAVFTRFGGVDVAMGWPLRYAHSPAEVIDTRDLDALGRIVAVIAKSW
ncbi:MAG TPA: M20/M25/M40 family metallo-hydrolase [Candidatus Bathyarchaeia archaeon]|nr:M20/M25/M40 family metallo-hydrolase [Candidatus Bathyarchaeia archaeon]